MHESPCEPGERATLSASTPTWPLWLAGAPASFSNADAVVPTSLLGRAEARAERVPRTQKARAALQKVERCRFAFRVDAASVPAGTIVGALSVIAADLRCVRRTPRLRARAPDDQREEGRDDRCHGHQRNRAKEAWNHADKSLLNRLRCGDATRSGAESECSLARQAKQLLALAAIEIPRTARSARIDNDGFCAFALHLLATVSTASICTRRRRRKLRQCSKDVGCVSRVNENAATARTWFIAPNWCAAA